MAFSNERAIGNAAANRLTASLRSKIRGSGFKNHINNGKEDLLTFTAGHAYITDHVNTLGETMPYLNGLYIRMPHHGFIQHYGSTTIRMNSSRKRTKPKVTRYNFATHYYNLPAKNFLDKAIQDSGVIPFILTEITAMRAEDILVHLIRSMENTVR